MAIDEVLTRLRRDLEATYGVDAATYLMDRPRGGWDSLVTKDELESELEKLELRLEKRLHEELRQQTWQLAKLVAGAQGVVVAAVAAIGIVLRFA
jgi:DNA-binding IclR family transcriptional regulator